MRKRNLEVAVTKLFSNIEKIAYPIVKDEYSCFTDHFAYVEDFHIQWVEEFYCFVEITIEYGMKNSEDWIPNRRIVISPPLNELDNKGFLRGMIYSKIMEKEECE